MLKSKTLFIVDVQNFWFGAKMLQSGAKIDYIKLRKTPQAMVAGCEVTAYAYVTTKEDSNNTKFKSLLSNTGYTVREKEEWSCEDIIKDIKYLLSSHNYDNIVIGSGDGLFLALLESKEVSHMEVGIVCFKDNANDSLLEKAKSIYFLTEKDFFRLTR